MEPVPNNPPLVVIVGQTASGKSALAMELARRFDGEIIAADSRTIYKGMDIGTAKPTLAERSEVPHHLIDVVAPDEPFTVADFQRLALQALDDIAARSKLPLLVGGSGLYVDAVIYSFGFRSAPNPVARERLQGHTVEELQDMLRDEGILLPTNERNPRHLIRALETAGAPAVREPLRPNTLVLGLELDRGRLRQSIELRVEQMCAAGFVEEVRRLAEQYGWDVPALQAPGYRAFRQYIEGAISLEDAKKLFVQNDMQYAKRQKTWFKRNQDINYISNSAEAVDMVTTFLNK
jgi:tRNA dimethylallyltransferase